MMAIANVVLNPNATEAAPVSIALGKYWKLRLQTKESNLPVTSRLDALDILHKKWVEEQLMSMGYLDQASITSHWGTLSECT